ncbi:glycoside hydrolase family 3 N-terminal domain-containing protein [Sphingobacterium spiritivorum]|uniref:Glycosyl hydrolase family 3 C-terminal domain protein n=1 Tax=Sphingobacterium spiritivorum ATCC 33861 TaxID=525373 RepID=D7VRR5_SPHSI|nr:glycoside hydrolase family 3 N-terminal domain-containing protein [Sphingobacterium spiritivorum]EFK56466.1 glycosyl hydrolase family 3 C-terminal domain protein [Sphingobacterium spiritivorum ATCC 33861]QQT35466.1 glycoside hydrolase family 3 C-terminal domain-containing protein [Sphingobacterium spiritivorum]WQD32154.1 glycoside hydrolase family 3 N-terminal domain-containing protein [Sphingobacterium spiritivorum]SUJ05944.1 Periplasmic beta-glucosidase precursor [Sphingobacterium spiritiv
MRKLSVVIYTLLLSVPLPLAAQKPVYKDASQSVEIRTRDLIQRMTLEEKVGQLLCPLGWEMYERKGNTVTVSQKFKDIVANKHIGMLWATLRADPWTQKTIANGLNPQLSAEAANALQKYVIENTRLGIPVFLAEEAPHGHMAIGTTVFPTGIGQASTWNPALLQKMSATVAKEVRQQGAHISYGPVLDLSRDPRWSRVEESYGEDPVLTGTLAAAIVRGLGSGNLSDPFATIPTLKHFVAYGIPEGGHNGSAASVGERELREYFLPPFQSAVAAGAKSVMAAYNSVDGIPCSSNKFLLTDILRKEWSFNGFTVSDLGSIEGIKGSHRVAKDHKQAAILAIEAGLDADLGGNAYVRLIEAVKQGEVQENSIDQAVSRILALKFEMGLFEKPFVDVKTAKKEVKTESNIALSRQVARESIVLLENKNNILPLRKDVKIAIVGPNADNVYNMLGDYTAPQPDGAVTTVRQAISARLPKAQVSYVKGCAIRDTTNSDIPAAVTAARQSDIIVAVVGGSSARDFKTEYISTGAAVASDKSVSDMESGEGFDRSTLDLLGRQMELLKALKQTGKPLVVIYIQGRPLNMNWAATQADALLCAWYPGQEGGHAIADVLFGDYNPAGKMPLSVPRSVGQIPVHYNRKSSLDHRYVEEAATPLYAFGYGKSYSDFEYKDLKIQKENTDYHVSFTLTNTGKYDGDEVPQLYIRNQYASVSQPVQQLKHFERIHLKTGESKTVSFVLTAGDFSVINTQMKKVLEPGSSFKIRVGSASDDIRLQQDLEI